MTTGLPVWLRRYGPIGLILAITMVMMSCGGTSATPTTTTAGGTAPATAVTADQPAPIVLPVANDLLPRDPGGTWPVDYPVAGQGGVPASVEKLTVAVDQYGPNEINPWSLTATTTFHDYIHLQLMMEDPNGQLRPQWVTDFEYSPEGIRLFLNPDAVYEDGSPADGAALKENFLGLRGDFVGQFGYDIPKWNSSSVGRYVDTVDVISSTEVFVKTPKPSPTWMWVMGDIGFVLQHYGNPAQLKKGPDEYNKSILGAAQYNIKQLDSAETRIVLERKENFWADYPWYGTPQHRVLEMIAVPDEAARFALLKSEQVDMVYNVPWAIALQLAKSEDLGTRSINPGKGDLWSQTIQANGMLSLSFACPLMERESKRPKNTVDQAGVKNPEYNFPAICEGSPTLDRKVREALDMAIDRKGMSKGPHFGFSTPIGSIYHAGSWGSREELVFNPTPYNPERAKELLAEAGWADGFDLGEGAHIVFQGRPGIPEAAEYIASNWADIGVTIKWRGILAPDFSPNWRGGAISWFPAALQSWGRNSHSGVQINWYHRTNSYLGIYNDTIEDLYFKASTASDPEVMRQHVWAIEDEVHRMKETMPIYAMSLVMGYTDRVLSHPMQNFSPVLKGLDLIVLRD